MVGSIMEFFYESAGAAVLTAAIVLALFFIKSIVEVFRSRSEEARKAERLICALYAEIKANTEDLASFIAHASSRERIKQSVRNGTGDARPHMTTACHRIVYESHLTELADLPRQVILSVVEFYCQIDRLSALMEDIESTTYDRLSGDDRVQLVEDFWSTAERSVRLGHDVMHGLEVHAPLELTREALRPSVAPGTSLHVPEPLTAS